MIIQIAANEPPELLACLKGKVEVVPQLWTDVVYLQDGKLLAAVECKTWSNLVDERQRARLARQLQTIREKAPVGLLLTRGRVYRGRNNRVRFDGYESHITRKAFRNLCLSIKLHGIIMECEPDFKRQAERILELAEYFAKPDHQSLQLRPFLEFKAGYNLQEEMLTCITSVGLERARKLLKAFGTIGHIANAKTTDLMEVPDIGPISARYIWEAFR